jgi:hypothetical protein
MTIVNPIEMFYAPREQMYIGDGSTSDGDPRGQGKLNLKKNT